MTEKATMVKTWRVLKDSLKVGHSSRLYGELIPEASEWAFNIRASYERAGYIESVYVSQEEFDNAIAEYKKREAESAPKEEGAVKKKTIKKSTSKKRIVKKGKKSDGGNEPRLSEPSGEASEDGRGTEGSEGLQEVTV